MAEHGRSEELRTLLFGTGSPDDPDVHPVDRAAWEYAGGRSA
jgi:hypothetical protein